MISMSYENEIVRFGTFYEFIMNDTFIFPWDRAPANGEFQNVKHDPYYAEVFYR